MKARMNASIFHKRLIKNTTDVEIDLLTLVEKKPIKFTYEKGALLVTNSARNRRSITLSEFGAIYKRYKAARPCQRTKSSYYNTPKFPQAFDRNFAPYIMRLVHFYETAQ
jgi:hypothetical protein